MEKIGDVMPDLSQDQQANSLGTGDDETGGRTREEWEEVQWWDSKLRLAKMTRRDQERYNFDTFKDRPQLRAAVKACRQYATGDTPYHMLTLAGPTGCGKTHLVKAICLEWIDRGQNVRMTPVVEMLDDLKANDIFSVTASNYAKFPLLVLDDLGVEHNTPWASSILDGLINLRYDKGKHTVVTTNLKGRDLPERIASRLRDVRQGLVLQIVADDYRLIKDVPA